MSIHQHHQERFLTVIPALRKQQKQHQDSSGYPVFSIGDAGAMHVFAHRMLDEDRSKLGHRLLGAWLDHNTGSGSEWVHLQWHMAVFDVSLGHWHAALKRYLEHILPAVTSSYDALTDAPALLWRLFLTAGKAAALPWEPVRSRAVAAIHQTRDPYVEIHNLLALAGAKDLDTLDRCLKERPTHYCSRIEVVVVQIGNALRSYAAGAYATAATQFEKVIPHVAEVGGSRAQNQIFSQLYESASGLASNGGDPMPLLKVA